MNNTTTKIGDMPVNSICGLYLLRGYMMGQRNLHPSLYLIAPMVYIADCCARVTGRSYGRGRGFMFFLHDADRASFLTQYHDFSKSLSMLSTGNIESIDESVWAEARDVLYQQSGDYMANGIEACLSLIEGYESPFGLHLLSGVFWYGGNGSSLASEGMFSGRQIREAIDRVLLFCDWVNAWYPETT